MKRKYYGLISSIVMLMALTVTVLYALGVRWSREPVRVRPLTTLSHISIPDPSAAKEIMRLEAKMADLAIPPKGDPAPVDLKLFGDQGVGKFEPVSQSDQAVASVQMDYYLTLAFSSGKKRFCMIDGSFYKEGTVLPDGGRIERIESNRVLVGKGEFIKWIPVDKLSDSKGK